MIIIMLRYLSSRIIQNRSSNLIRIGTYSIYNLYRYNFSTKDTFVTHPTVIKIANSKNI